MKRVTWNHPATRVKGATQRPGSALVPFSRTRRPLRSLETSSSVSGDWGTFRNGLSFCSPLPHFEWGAVPFLLSSPAARPGRAFLGSPALPRRLKGAQLSRGCSCSAPEGSQGPSAHGAGLWGWGKADQSRARRRGPLRHRHPRFPPPGLVWQRHHPPPVPQAQLLSISPRAAHFLQRSPAHHIGAPAPPPATSESPGPIRSSQGRSSQRPPGSVQAASRGRSSFSGLGMPLHHVQQTDPMSPPHIAAFSTQMQLRQQRPLPAISFLLPSSANPQRGKLLSFPGLEGSKSLAPSGPPAQALPEGQSLKAARPGGEPSVYGKRALRTQVPPARPQELQPERPAKGADRDPPFVPHARSTSYRAHPLAILQTPPVTWKGAGTPTGKPYHLRGSVVLVEVPHGNEGRPREEATVASGFREQRVFPKLGSPVPVHVSGECGSHWGRSPLNPPQDGESSSPEAGDPPDSLPTSGWLPPLFRRSAQSGPPTTRTPMEHQPGSGRGGEEGDVVLLADIQDQLQPCRGKAPQGSARGWGSWQRKGVRKQGPSLSSLCLLGRLVLAAMCLCRNGWASSHFATPWRTAGHELVGGLAGASEPAIETPFAARVSLLWFASGLWKGARHRHPHKFSLDEQCQPKVSFPLSPGLQMVLIIAAGTKSTLTWRERCGAPASSTEPSPYLQLEPSQALRPSPRGSSIHTPLCTHQTLPLDWRRRGAPSQPPS
ncbi:hypothetical protein E2320_011931 [Naja naja]|nr:hypothetical protein E2320_011931 [Naja naja]